MAYGYPEGGTGLSITKGIVSRIEFARYNFPVSGLRIQIDAAINPGNSGGPAVVGDKMIGLVFSQYGNAENIGYIIPCEEINLFLQGYRAAGITTANPPCTTIFKPLKIRRCVRFLSPANRSRAWSCINLTPTRPIIP